METRLRGDMRLLVLCTLLACADASAQTQAPSANQNGRNAVPTARRVDALQRQLEAQGQQIETLRSQLAEQETRYREMQERLNQPQEARQEARKPAMRAPGTAETAAAAAAGAAAVANGSAPENGQRPIQVGVAQAEKEVAPPMAQIFDEPSILTPRGHFVLEPSFQYSYSSNDRVALVGYTVIPAILIGLIDVREVKRNMLVPALTGRWGVSNKMELELRVPYVIRSDTTVSREIFTGASQDNVFDTKGHGLGDIEMAMRYQLFSAKDNWPYLVGGLRFKSRTGKDPFEVVTDCVNRCLGNTTGTGLPLDAPTGSGFYSLQPSLTWLYPTDPAVFFGGLSYTYNFARDNVSRLVLDNQKEMLGSIKPGDVWGVNFGMGLSINERSSFSLGVELYSLGPTEQNGLTVRGSVRTQLASLLLGYSFRLTDKTNINVSVGAGLTRDTPDLTLTVRVPMSFEAFTRFPFMLPLEVLCLTLDGDASGAAAQLVAHDWAVTHAHNVAAAQRMLAHGHFHVGLLIAGAAVGVPVASLESLVHGSEAIEWVALCEAPALEQPEFRDLVLDCFFDQQVLPVDWASLSVMLQHAQQRALLRQRRRGETHSHDALGMVGQGTVIARLRAEIRKVANTQAPVLIGGESGSGKELAARAIHQCSPRAAGPFVVVNCGAIAPSLIHSELFGHERGAFTGASSERRGLIEAANGGTIFLDEIGDLPLDLQTNLLRFLQEKTIIRVGAVRNLKVDVRVVAASHVDLAEAVAVGRFREDLFYRLNVLSIDVLPLRKRMEDVPVLAEYFFQRCAGTSRTRARGFSRQSMDAMQAHAWPGNVRELYNRVQRAVVMTDRRLIAPVDLGLSAADNAVGVALNTARTTAERDIICLTLNRVGRNITHAARELGVSRMTLYRLIDKHSIALDEPPRQAAPSWNAAPAPLRIAPSRVAG